MTLFIGDITKGIPMGSASPDSGSGGGGGSENYVTLDGTQTIEGNKKFTSQISADGGIRISEESAASASWVGFSVGEQPDDINNAPTTYLKINQANYQGIGRDMEIGVRCQYDPQQCNCYITAPYNATDFFINNYYDGSSSNGIASKVTISGPLYNKLNSVEYPVLNSATGIQYQSLTSTEYTELQAKSESTIYRLTDTNEVYLGTIKLTGGGNITPAMYAGVPTGGQNTGYVGTNTVTTYDPETT